MTNDPAARLGRIRFRAWRRGFREADMILGPFAEAHAETLAGPELEAFERLLDEDDHQIYGWILETLPTPEHWDGPLMARIRAFVASQVASRVSDGIG